ncbi:MAG TPA: WecB/TagA/CpsF family glycosyltransferase [Croceibacterium sp.]|nr:WecB/TagA/CpsF family glycosyltransferase [Croceibacterium sp.]
MTLPEPREDSASFLGLRFDGFDRAHALEAVRSLAAQDAFAYVVTPNVDHIVRLHRQRDDRRLWACYAGAALSLCDSRILKALASISGVRLELVPGSDLTADLLASPEGLRAIAVIGGDATLIRELRLRYPGVTWHWHAPPHGVLHDPAAQEAIVAFVEECPAGLFCFAIGAPQSELVCARIAERGLARGVGLCIGASLEFLTGAKARAPRWMQQAGLEWLFRLLSEPARLWRRYLVEGPQIFLIWWRWRLSSSR